MKLQVYMDAEKPKWLGRFYYYYYYYLYIYIFVH